MNRFMVGLCSLLCFASVCASPSVDVCTEKINRTVAGEFAEVFTVHEDFLTDKELHGLYELAHDRTETRRDCAILANYWDAGCAVVGGVATLLGCYVLGTANWSQFSSSERGPEQEIVGERSKFAVPFGMACVGAGVYLCRRGVHCETQKKEFKEAERIEQLVKYALLKRGIQIDD